MFIARIHRRRRQRREAEAAAAAVRNPPVQVIVVGPAVDVNGKPATVVAPGMSGIDPPSLYHDRVPKAVVDMAPKTGAFERRHFFIVNEATGSVLEVRRGRSDPDTRLVVETRRQERPAYQIWYIDEEGVIRSKLNNFAIDRKEKADRLRMMPYAGNTSQKWVLDGNRVVNEVRRDDCLGLKKLKTDADVVANAYEGKPHQHWRVEYTT